MLITPIQERQVEISDEIRRLAEEHGWPLDLVRWARQLGYRDSQIRWWITERGFKPEEVRQALERRQSLMTGTMHSHEASWLDEDALADLFASSPEEIGDYEVTVERSPYPFAQFRLQENASVIVIDDQGVLLACGASSARNAIVAGKRIAVLFISSYRVRRELRGRHLSRMIQEGPGRWGMPIATGAYYFVRSQNFAAEKWARALNPDMVDSQPEREGDVRGLPIHITHFAAADTRERGEGIRAARRSDIRACVRLINRTQRGLDLFRPYTVDFLQGRLDDVTWGPRPDWWIPIYSWPDYYVLEEDGRIVACAGLWDRGAHVREVWRHKENGSVQMFDPTAVMDFGYAAGREDAMERLLRYLLRLSAEKDRSGMLAPLQFLPDLYERLAGLRHRTETRSLGWNVWDEKLQHLKLTRPYTDLAYW
ncbi:MAG: hypothetical protein HYS09_07670 [Chloroflexi bacterium]|nr:hypothetical protein [Chloroflexota bacterium]